MKADLAEESDDLGALSDAYEEKHGEHGLFALLSSLFVATTVADSQVQLVRYNWKEIYTTNYDNVLQLCCADAGKRYSTYTASNRPADVDYRTLPLIHINGLVAGAIFNNFRKEIKLTDTQYYTDDFSRSAWGERFRNDIITSPCIVFAGYSLYDLDVARILHSFEGMQERIFFVLKDPPSRANEKKLQQFGTILTIGVEGLANLAAEILAEPYQKTPAPLSAWEQIALPKAGRAPRDIDAINFLMSGNINEEQFASDVIEKNYKIVLDRSVTEQIVGLLDQGRLKNALLFSNVGNGKTTALDAICYKLCARGHSVYRSGPNKELLLKEVPILRQIEGRIVLIVDDAFGNREVIRAVQALGREDICVVTSARTSQYELQEGEIKAAFANTLETFSLDELDNKEIAALISLLDSYALWGDRQSLPKEQKDHFIRNQCARELRAIILDLLDSPNLKGRIENIIKFDSLELRDRVLAILVISQLLNLAQIRADISLIGEMFQIDARKAILEHERKLRDFALIQNGRISMRSSILSEYILKKLIDTGFVIDVMTRSMGILDLIHSNDNQYREVFRNFSRFRFVEQAIAVEKRLTHMVTYFENLKELSQCRENPLFWLQYAMCRLSLAQYPEASRLFDVAFAYAEKSGYLENRHLNNQYARFLLESRSNSNEYTDYMPAFNRAHGIVVKQMRDEQTTYNPYRVAINYFNFLHRRVFDLTTGDLVSILRSCGEVKTQIARRAQSKAISGSRVVEECAKAMRNCVGLLRKTLKDKGVDV